MYKLILLLILNVIQITFQESFSRLRVSIEEPVLEYNFIIHILG